MSVYEASPLKRERWTRGQLDALDEAIVAAVEEDYPVTLRGVFYRVESAGAIEKSDAGYQRVGRQLLKLRRAGTIPYPWVTDGTRWITKPTTWTDIDEMLEDASTSYRRALWHDADVEVQVFTEKDAISGVVLPVTSKWDVPLGVLRGYCSESFAYSVAQAIKDCGKRKVYVYQLGDHDPSGVDAWRAFRESVAGFLGEKVTAEMAAASQKYGFKLDVGSAIGVQEIDPGDHCPDWESASAYLFCGGAGFHAADSRTVTFARLAVTEDQISDLGLPTRPTKRKDSRAKNFAGGSVEVDAIPARILRGIVEDAIVQHVDSEHLRLTRIYEQSEREIFSRMRGELANGGGSNG